MRYMAVDIGASSGRIIGGTLKNGKAELCELRRFSNTLIPVGYTSFWDVLAMFVNIRETLDAEKSNVRSVGIDTFGMGIAMLDRNGHIAANMREHITAAYTDYMREFALRFGEGKLYGLTGIADRSYNTSYMLYAMAREKLPALEIAEDIGFLPDILTYLLTGEIYCDASIASPGQILTPDATDWSDDIFSLLGVPKEKMAKLIPPASARGKISRRVMDGDIDVAFAGHDTAAAVLAVPAEEKSFAFISSGTWSLMGVKRQKPVITDYTCDKLFSNVLTLDSEYMVLKNIFGMGLLENCRKVWARQGRDYSWSDMATMALEAGEAKAHIDVNDDMFISGKDIPKAVRVYCRARGCAVPETDGEVVRVIYESIALAYRKTIEELEMLHGMTLDKVYIVGGGSRNAVINQMAADAMGKIVIAGPDEAAAMGNVLMQAVNCGDICRDDIGGIVRASCDVREYIPHSTEKWQEKISLCR